MASRVLFSNHRYMACVTRAGLTVQNTRTGKGVCFAPSHSQYADHVEAFETALDADEREALCRALFRA